MPPARGQLQVAANEYRITFPTALQPNQGFSVTLFQVAVALCAIAALTKRKPLWGVGLAASVIGVALFIAGLLAPA